MSWLAVTRLDKNGRPAGPREVFADEVGREQAKRYNFEKGPAKNEEDRLQNDREARGRRRY